jgi:hypothetical protein
VKQRTKAQTQDGWYRQKVAAQTTVSFSQDVFWEARMIAQVRVAVYPANCVHCQHEFLPRYLGDQVCGVCR